MDKFRYLVVEGPIGAGKTSLARRLGPRLSADLLLEQPQENPFIARFYQDINLLPNDLAFAAGSRQRASGRLLFPVQAALLANPGSSLREDGRFLECFTSAGDLDGDGAEDLLTTSTYYELEGNETDGFGYAGREPELHIHYGVPGGAAAPPVR